MWGTEHLFALVPPPWEKELTEMEALSELRNYNPGVTLVGTCAVCNMPVREEDDPTEVYPVGGGPAGVIHGAFDCMDAEVCPIRRGVTAGGGANGIQVCLLPDAHGGECLWSEPS